MVPNQRTASTAGVDIIRLATRAAWFALAPLAIGLTLAGVAPRFRQLSVVYADANPTWILAFEVALTGIFFVTALIVAGKRRHDPLALFLSMTLIFVGATETSMTDALTNADYSALATVWRWPVLVITALALVCALTLLYIFPDGHFTPAWTKPLALIWALLHLAWLLIPDLPFNTIYGSTWRATPLASLLISIGWFSTGVIALIVRYRRITDPIQRQQTWWIAVGLIAAVAGGCAYYTLQVLAGSYQINPLGDAYWVGRYALQTIGMGLLPICLAVAILRYRLFNLHIIINRTLVHGTLSLIVIGVYIGVVTVLGQIFSNEESWVVAIAATGVVAVLFQPLRVRLQRVVDRLLYGSRNEPYAVLSALSRRLAQSLSPDAALHVVVETVVQALKLPYAAIHLRAHAAPHPRPVVAAGVPTNAVERITISAQGTALGELHVAPRPGETSLARNDRLLLEDLAQQAGSAVQAAYLTAELQHAHMRLISAREEERRRLRRDFHDGLGPTLASIAQRIGMAADAVDTDGAHSRKMLNELADQVRTAMDGVRQLVYNLRPPALDQYGLIEALRQGAAGLEGADLVITLELPPRLPPLSAAVEVALYRVAMEALTNVVRHAGATLCRLSLATATDRHTRVIILTICDNGRGIRPGFTEGVGLRAMRERATALGGKLAITALPAGTMVQATIPCGIVDDHSTQPDQ